MTRPFFWFALFLISLSYLSSSFSDEWKKKIRLNLYVGDQIESNLSLKKTSSRWKYPFGNHNASLNEKDDLVFPASDLPIVSIKINKNDFFSYQKGIYIRGIEEWTSKANDLPWWEWPANYRQRGKVWEREAEISFIGFSQNTMVQKAAIRINGNATRAFSQKSLRLTFEDGIRNLFFKDQSEQSYTTMILRNGGNDWDGAFMRDVLISNLSKKLNFETQDAISCNVFFNGEYWGIHYLRPKIDDDFLSKRYGLSKNNISILEAPFEIYKGDSLGYYEFKNLLTFIDSNDLKADSIYSLIIDQIDIQSFVDFIIIELFIVNIDWPQNNWMLWKDLSNNYNHGKWKWILKDTDYSLGFFNEKAYAIDMSSKLHNSTGAISIIFSNLMLNDQFKILFNNRKTELFNNEWSPIHFNTAVDSLKLILNPEMPNQINRWRTHNSLKKWDSEILNLKYFYNKRITNF